MNLTLNTSRIASVLRQLGATAAVIIGALGSPHIATDIRTALVAVGGLLMSVEHGLTKVTEPKAPKGSQP